MSNITCPKPLQGSSMRVTQVDSCGHPLFGECAFAVSDGFVSVTFTPNVEDGERFLQRNAAGRAIVNQRSAPILNWYDVVMEFQEVDLELFSIVTGLPVIRDDQQRAIGLPVTESNFATANFALEVWASTSEEECPPTGTPLPFYGYNLVPWVVEGALNDDYVIQNDLITFKIAGRSRKGTPWGVGPYDVVLDQTGDPSPLFDEIPSDTHFLPLWTQLAPPEPECGCQSLSS